VVVGCPGWPNSRLEVPSTSPASGSRRRGDSQRRVRARRSIRARFEEISPHYIYAGGQAFSVVHLPVWIAQREDVGSICVRRTAFHVKHVKSSTWELETPRYVVGRGYAPGPKLLLAILPSIEMNCNAWEYSRRGNLLPPLGRSFELADLISAYFLLVLASKYCT